MTEQWTTAARCFGWTTVLIGSIAISMGLTERLGDAALPWAWIAPIVVDLLIGIRVRAWWWVWGPIGILLVFGVGITLWMAYSAATYDGPSSMGPGVAMGFFLGGVILAMVVGSLVHGIAETAGVWWGKRGEEPTY